MSKVKEAYTEVFNSDGEGLTTQVVVKSVYPKQELNRPHGLDRVRRETRGHQEIRDGRIVPANNDQLIGGDMIQKSIKNGRKILVGASAQVIRLNIEAEWEEAKWGT